MGDQCFTRPGQVVNPATEELMGEVPAGSAADVEVRSEAGAAFDGGLRSGHERAAVSPGWLSYRRGGRGTIELIVAEAGVTSPGREMSMLAGWQPTSPTS